MPLIPARFQNTGGNQLLQNILGGANVSLTRALSDSVQLTRDATSNQLAQEQAFLGERRFDRNFRERQFQDRRDFARGVLESDRNFDEGARRFNIGVLENNADRDLRAQLGFGQLALSRDRFEASQEAAGVTNDLRLGEEARRQARFEQELEDRQSLDALQEEANLLNNPEELLRQRPDLQNLNSEEFADFREREIARNARDFEFFNRRDRASAGRVESQGVGATVEATPRDQQANGLSSQAGLQLEQGDAIGASSTLAEAIVTAQPGSPTQARLITQKNEVDANLVALREGSSISRESALAAADLYNSNRAAAFADGRLSFLQEVEAARGSATRQEFINAGVPERDEQGRPATDATRDRIARIRGEFYDAIRSSSQADVEGANALGDPFGQFIDAATR